MSDTSKDALIKMEANIDNMNPEQYGGLLDRYLQAGANDAWMTPIIMKKGRPAIMLSILCRKELLDTMRDITFRHTTTIGMRYTPYERFVCEREFRTVTLGRDVVHVKEAFWKGKRVNVSLEYEDLAAIAEKEDKPIKEIEKKVWRLLSL